jgi:Na+-transporting NADH:ubiquinone oxidoreductase subunit NqrB
VKDETLRLIANVLIVSTLAKIMGLYILSSSLNQRSRICAGLGIGIGVIGIVIAFTAPASISFGGLLLYLVGAVIFLTGVFNLYSSEP